MLSTVQNLLPVALRRIGRQKSFSFLNIVGLSIGICAALLVFQIVLYESGFNKKFKNYDRIVKMVGERNSAESGQIYLTGNATSAMIAAQASVMQFEASSRVRLFRPTIIVPDPKGGTPIKKLELSSREVAMFAEPAFFEVFDFASLSGDQEKALIEPGSVLLSRQLAETCFDHWQSAIGQTLLVDNALMTVKGVMENPHEDSDFPVSLLISYATLLADKEKYDYVENWERNRGNDQLYALLKGEDQFAAANEAVGQIGVKEYAAASNSKQIGENRHFLQPLSDLHFDQRFGTPGGRQTERSYLWLLSSIGLFVLLLGSFNFVNLSTAQAIQRAKEVGVRKTLGSSRRTLFWPFIAETGLMVSMSVILGVLLAQMGGPFLRQFSNLPDHIGLFSRPAIWIFLLVLTAILTLFSGFYPALVISGFSPNSALGKESGNGVPEGVRLRKGLVVLQFVIAQVLMIGAIVSVQQMSFIQDKNLGFQKDLIYMFPFKNTTESRLKLSTMKQQMLAIPGVESMTLTSMPPASRGSWMTSFTVGRGKEAQPFNLTYLFADTDFQKTFGLELLAGRWYGPADTTTGYVINETLMRKVGISNPQEAIGQELRLENDPFYPIVGVVKDFHSKPLQAGFEPIVLASYRDLYAGAAVKIKPENVSTTNAAIRQIFDETFPEQVFNGNFYDETIANFYAVEERFSKSCRFFALLAILIACLGLFGLAAHTTTQRTKEIGIRKVLGASTAGLVGLLSRDFLTLVIIAFLVAAPLAYIFMDKWLRDFAYRIDIQWAVFAAAGMVAVSVAFLTVSFQSMKAALANPVKSLRNE